MQCFHLILTLVLKSLEIAQRKECILEVLPLSTNDCILFKPGKAVMQAVTRSVVSHVEAGGFSFRQSDKCQKQASEFGCFRKRLQLEKLDLIKYAIKTLKYSWKIMNCLPFWG